MTALAEMILLAGLKVACVCFFCSHTIASSVCLSRVYKSLNYYDERTDDAQKGRRDMREEEEET